MNSQSPAKKLSLQKSTISILTQQADRNPALVNPIHLGALNTNPPDTGTCLSCVSLTPDACNTAICVISM